MVPLIPLRHLFDNPERAAARISPDGRFLSWLAPLEGVLNVWVRAAAGGDPWPVTRDRHRGVRAYLWARDSSRLLYLQDAGGDENTHLFAVDRDGSRPARDLTPYPGVRAGLIAAPRATPRHVLVSMNLRDRSLFDAYRITLATGRLELVGRNPGDVLGWQEDREGRIRAAMTQTPAGDHTILVRDSEGAPFRTVAEYANEDAGHPYAFTPDGSRLWVGSARDSDLVRLVELDPADGSERVIDADDEADLAGALISGRTGELLGAAYLRDRLRMNLFDDRLAADWEAIRALHPGDPHIGSQDDAETRMVVGFNDDRDPGATFLYDRTSRTAQFLFRPRPRLDPETLAPMRPVRISSRDGLTLRSYLTLPLGAEPHDLPAVLLVHGGPWSRDAWGFHSEAQFLANRGYAVLQVNYRGSTGFGKAFTHAAEREFAGRMHDDLIDGVEWLVAEGIADRGRIAIYGGSYGGYAALVGASFTPEVFAAAISVVGPSSLVTLIRSFPAYWRPLLAGSWFRYVGDPDDPDQLADLEARSPLNRVEDIVAPLLVIQGANDPRVTKAESDQIVAALGARGVEVEYMVKDDEGHGFVRPENRMDAYRAVERFLARHLGGRSEG
ncbi:MAG: S9 family peptidase [Miltoncostaeaceae bacterium]